MLQIEAMNLGKKFLRRHVFKNFNYVFNSGKAYAVTGPNGSGKSTLLQLLCGYMMPSSGKVVYKVKEKFIDSEDYYKFCSISSPFLELIDEYSVSELIRFQRGLKPMIMEDPAEIAAYFQLGNEQHKPIKYLSSGNRQRVKLALAFCSKTEVLLLDEPTQNLDLNGLALYKKAMSDFAADRLVIVSSNDEREYGFCEEQINIEEYQK